MAISEKLISEAAGGFLNLPWVRQIGLLVGLSASIAFGFYFVLWSQTPNYLPLYASLEPKEISQVVDALEHENIDYKYDAGQGGVLVPVAKVPEVRMRLASLGLPKNAVVGLEVMDENQGFTGSQFAEFVRYRRGLEGELSRTISSLESIRNARVHLGLTKESSFIKKKSISSASVMVDVYGGRELTSSQIMGIVHLVASSVPGLVKENVTVVDHSGKLLSSSAQGNMTAALDQFNYTRQLEQVYSKRIQDLLTPILGMDRVRAEVTADVDFTAKEETQEHFDPERQIVRSESTVVERKEKKEGVGGIPGSLSNQPPTAGKLSNNAAASTTDKKVAANDASGFPETSPDNLRGQSVRNFEMDKAVTYVKHNLGKLTRLSVAVVVDDKVLYDKKGREKKNPLTEEEMTRIKDLVKDAVGYQKSRGDTVSVINTSFAQMPPMTEIPAKPFYENPLVMQLLKQGFVGVVIILLVVMVFKPIFMTLVTVKREQGKLGVRPSDADLFDNEVDRINSIKGRSKSQVEQVKHIAQQDPKRVAHVVMNWVGQEDE